MASSALPKLPGSLARKFLQVPAGSSRYFSASPGACPLLHLDLCPASAPAPGSPSSDRNPTIDFKGPSWPHPPLGSSRSTFDGLSSHVFPPGSLTCPALTWSRCHPLPQENGKASRIPHWPTPPRPLPVLQPERAVQNAKARRKPARRPRAVGPDVPFSLLLPPTLASTSSPQPHRRSPLGLFISLLLPARPRTELFPSLEKLLLSFQPRDLS